ncbi:MAG: cache domain-containing protein, partial [Sphaerochaetaceae bacterium]|nr:cache domain-containing protein [Sphaerochaetaceae bacterium]
MELSKKSREKKILDGIKLYPLIILIVFSFATTYFINQHNAKYLKRNIEIIKSDYISQQKDMAKKEVNKIFALIEHIYNIDKNKYSKKEIRNKIVKIVKSLKYDIDGYIFIMNQKGDFYVNINKKLLESNQWDLQDKDGNYVIRQIVQFADEKKGFITYNSLEGTFKDDSKKVSFIKVFDELNLIIGYGFQPSKIEAKILKKQEKFRLENSTFINKIIFANILFAIFLTMYLFFYSKDIEKRFIKYKNILQKINYKNRRKDELIYQQSKMASIGEMLSIISHQWRQPLSQINTVTMDIYVEHMKNELNKKSLEKHIKSIEETTKYLSNTI